MILLDYNDILKSLN